MKNLSVGQIVNTFGIKGFVKVNPWVNDVTRFDSLKKVYIKIRKEEKVLEKVRRSRTAFIKAVT